MSSKVLSTLFIVGAVALPAPNPQGFSIPSLSTPTLGGGGGFPSLSLPAGGLPTGGLGGGLPTGGLGGGQPSLSLPAGGMPTGGLGGGLPSGGLGGGLPSLSLPAAGGALPTLPASGVSGGTPTLTARQAGFSIPAIPGVGSDTSNDLTSGACKALTYIFARGTTETGNMGSTVGPAFATKLKAAFGDGNVAVQGVDYSADISGAISGSISPQSAAGATKMKDLVNQANSKCPDTKILVAGYSQGAQQVHGALMGLKTGDVDAAVTFGDPLSKTAFQNIDKSKTKVFCADGDDVCNDSFVITAAHLSYATDSVGPAADFVKSAVA